MSKLIIYKCDSCGKRTDDHLEEEGWLVIEGTKVQYTCGRKENRTAKILERSVFTAAHFCCAKCFLDWLVGINLRDCDIHIDTHGMD